MDKIYWRWLRSDTWLYEGPYFERRIDCEAYGSGQGPGYSVEVWV